MAPANTYSPAYNRRLCNSTATVNSRGHDPYMDGRNTVIDDRRISPAYFRKVLVGDSTMHRMNRDERISMPARNIVAGWQAGGKREETRVRSFALSILTCFDWDGATPLPTYEEAVDILKWAQPTM